MTYMHRNMLSLLVTFALIVLHASSTPSPSPSPDDNNKRRDKYFQDLCSETRNPTSCLAEVIGYNFEKFNDTTGIDPKYGVNLTSVAIAGIEVSIERASFINSMLWDYFDEASEPSGVYICRLDYDYMTNVDLSNIKSLASSPSTQSSVVPQLGHVLGDLKECIKAAHSQAPNAPPFNDDMAMFIEFDIAAAKRAFYDQ